MSATASVHLGVAPLGPDTAAFDAPDIELNSAGNEDWFVAKLQK